MMYWAGSHCHCRASLLLNKQPYSHLVLVSVASLNTASHLWCTANSLTLRATHIRLFVRAHPRVAAFHHLRRWLSVTQFIVAVSLRPATLYPSLSNCSRLSTHASQHKSVFPFFTFRSHNRTSADFDS